MEELTVAEAKAALQAAKERERAARFVRAEQVRREFTIKVAEANKKFKLAENAKLACMIGRTVAEVEFLTEAEGTIRFKFDDGIEFFVTASGDDATYISFGFEGEDNGQKHTTP